MAKKWLPSAILLELFARTPTRSCPRCQHSYSGTTSATKPPKRRNMPGICGMKPSLTLEYHHIPDWSARTVPEDPLYSREYSGIRSCQTPLIFQKRFRNIWQMPKLWASGYLTYATITTRKSGEVSACGCFRDTGGNGS